MTDSPVFEEQAEVCKQAFLDVKTEMNKVIVGQDDLIHDVLTALFAGGHVLLEGVPGIGKTMMVHTLADAVDCEFSRIQFTPDLMPSDIIGTRVVLEDDQGRKRFEFQRGPLFTQVLLADEINRATPKTQSALLEAMQEKSVTVAGETHRLNPPFFVIATQNPLEMEGTFPLPEAQLDRFFYKLNVFAPSFDQLIEVIRRTTRVESPTASHVLTGADLGSYANVIREVPVAEHIEHFAARVLRATHPNTEDSPDLINRYVKVGASPRGLQAMILGGKVRALVGGRFHVAEDDIRTVATPALRHRVLLNFEGEAEEINPDDLVRSILESVSTAAAA